MERYLNFSIIFTCINERQLPEYTILDKLDILNFCLNFICV